MRCLPYLRYFLIGICVIPASIGIFLWLGLYLELFLWLRDFFKQFSGFEHYVDFFQAVYFVAYDNFGYAGAREFLLFSVLLLNAYYIYSHPPLSDDNSPMQRLRRIFLLWLKVKEAEMAQRAGKPGASR